MGPNIFQNTMIMAYSTWTTVVYAEVGSVAWKWLQKKDRIKWREQMAE